MAVHFTEAKVDIQEIKKREEDVHKTLVGKTRT